MILYASVGSSAKYAAMAFLALVVVVILIFVFRRIPRVPHGLVASEDYYALDRSLQDLDVYGEKRLRRTRKEAIETTKVPKDETALPPGQVTQRHELGNGRP